jgi:hypothetical protein
VFSRLVLKVSKVLRTSSVIVWVQFVRSFPYLLASVTSMNLTNSSGVRLGVTVGVAVAAVVMVGTVFLITSFFSTPLNQSSVFIGSLAYEKVVGRVCKNSPSLD